MQKIELLIILPYSKVLCFKEPVKHKNYGYIINAFKKLLRFLNCID